MIKVIRTVAMLNLALLAASAQEGFRDYGVGAKVAEIRNIVTTVTKDGRHLVICNATDEGKTGYVLVTDIDTGETKQCFCPPNVPQVDPFGSLMSRNGRFYTAQGRWLLEFDPNAGEWTFHGKPSKHVSAYLCFTQGHDGVVWTGGAYKTALVSFDPETREMKDHGLLDPKEHYLSFLAVDKAGWVYAGIGTARYNIVAYNPKTGEKRQLVKEEDRSHGTALVYPTTDGTVYGRVGKQSFRLLEGTATPIERSEAAPRLHVGDVKYGGRAPTFPDGRKITRYDIENRLINVQHPKTKAVKTIEFDYESEGASLTSLAEGPNGVVYASSCHPMHLVALDTKAKAQKDLGPVPTVGGGNFCAMARQGDLLIGAQYSAGRLWAYDVTKPWNPKRSRKTLGVPAQELVKSAECKDGHFTYLRSHDVAFLCGDKFGAEGTFKLRAPADGEYYLHILPYRSARYCTVQFLFDGQEIGKPYVATNKRTGPGQLLVHVTMELKSGEHRLTVRTLESKGQEPWCAVVSVDLSRERRERLILDDPGNPYVIAQWKRDICRPRTALAHPDGKHVMMAGFAGYGLCGGGIGIYNLQTKETTLLAADRDLLRGHSCITLKALPNGDLVGGTSIDAPGGGHVIAKEAELFILDWQTKKVTFHMVPVPGDANIVNIHVPSDGLVYGLSGNSTFFVFDPKDRKIVHSETLKRYGRVPRHALQLGPDGNLYAMLSKAVVRITPGSFKHEKLADSPVPITAGGALVNGQLCFASSSHVWTYSIPGL